MTHDEFYAAVDEGRKALKHYGVLGMKWGIRRYQNPDGTLTALGRKHMEDGKTQKEIDKWERKKERAIAKGDQKFMKKNLDILTNADIQKFTERIKARNTIKNFKKESESISSERFKNWLNTASAVTQNAANMAENGVRLYNTVVKINNSFSSKKLDPIKTGSDSENSWKKVTKSYTDKDGNKVVETYNEKIK